ncbi:MAG: class I SAM-dependent methyltransferase [Pseudomonadota bacterium]
MIQQQSFDHPALIDGVGLRDATRASDRVPSASGWIKRLWLAAKRAANHIGEMAGRPRDAHLRRTIVTSVRLADARVLEVNVGRGTGLTHYDRSCEVVGTESDTAALNATRQRLARDTNDAVAGVYRAPETRLGFRDSSFDAVMAFFVFNSGRRPSRVLAELLRVTRPGGRIVIVDRTERRRMPGVPSLSLSGSRITAAAGPHRRSCAARRLPHLLARCPDLEMIRERTLGAVLVTEFKRA